MPRREKTERWDWTDRRRPTTQWTWRQPPGPARPLQVRTVHRASRAPRAHPQGGWPENSTDWDSDVRGQGATAGRGDGTRECLRARLPGLQLRLPPWALGSRCPPDPVGADDGDGWGLDGATTCRPSWSAARRNHRRASVSSSATPRPLSYITPRLLWAGGKPCLCHERWQIGFVHETQRLVARRPHIRFVFHLPSSCP